MSARIGRAFSRHVRRARTLSSHAAPALVVAARHHTKHANYAAVAAAAAAAAGVTTTALCESHPETFSGQWCASVTEFGADGAVTTTNVNKYAAHLAKEGCAGVFVNGTSGESMSLSVEERERLAAAWKRAGDLHGLKIVVHVGCDSTVDAARLAAHAERLGCAGVSAMAPRFFKCGGAAQLAEYCAFIAGAAPRTPFLYYHFPMATGVPTKPSEFFAAAKPLIPTLAGMKFSDGNMWEYGDCCDADASGALAFMPGFEAQTLAYLPYHPRETFGAISLSFSVLAPLHARIADKFYGGDAADAHHLQAASRKFFRAVTPYGWTQSVKLALAEKGIFDSPACRAPSKNLTAQQQAELKAIFANLAAEDPRSFGGLLP